MKRSNLQRCIGTGRRGIAMLLVLVAMVVAVVLTSAAIVSRETSPMMGANATASVSATWSAESAANYAVGVLATGFDWVSAMGPAGTLVTEMDIGGVSVTVTLTDMEGDVPGADDRDLYMIAVATVDGISTTVRRMVSLGEEGDPIDAIDPMFGEFALLATRDLRVMPGAAMGVWGLSPEAGARPQIKLGTAFEQAGNLDVCVDDALGPVEMHVDSAGGAGLVSEVQGTGYALQWQMPVQLPVLMQGVPSAVMAGMPSGGDFEPSDGSTVVVPGATDYGRVRIRNNAVATLDGTVPVSIRCDRLELDNGTLRIVGDVSIYVRDRCRVENSGRIVLANAEADLRVYVCDELEIDGDAQVGIVESDAGRAASGLQTWVEPDQVQIFEVGVADGGSGAVTMTVENNATLLAAIHAPSGIFTAQTGGTLIGRATAGDLLIDATATVLYDPTLDNRIGFTNPAGPLYEADGSLDILVEEALDDAMASSGNDVGMFMTLVRSSYDDLVSLTGDQTALESAVQKTTHLFTGLTGIF